MPSSYATTADLAKYVPPAALVGISPADQQDALDEASGVADTYIRAQYTLPLAAPYDPALVRAVCRIAVWDLMNRRGWNPEAGANDVFQRGYDDALAWLLKLSRDDVSFASDADASSGVRLGGARCSSNPRRGIVI